MGFENGQITDENLKKTADPSPENRHRSQVTKRKGGRGESWPEIESRIGLKGKGHMLEKGHCGYGEGFGMTL